MKIAEKVAIGYIRVSTNDRAENGASLDSQRASAALQQKRSKGERAGQSPYGAKLARDGVRLLPHLTEQKAIRRAQRLRTRGLSLRGIAAKLGKEGHKPRGGNAWHPQTVSNI